MAKFECIELDSIDDVSVVKFRDQRVMDPSRIEMLGAELLSVIDGGEGDRMLINFENVSFFSSAAVSKLLVAEKRIRSQGGQLRLSNLTQEVRDIFSLTRLDTVFSIDDLQENAIDSLNDQ